MAIPAPLLGPGIELAFFLIQLAIEAGELTLEEAVKQVAAKKATGTANADASEANVDAAIERAENSQ